MTVTQYIGARYVPLFANPAEWDSTREYEPLTIVIYQGASYTSRQAVPVGVSIQNTDFWVLTGNYNAQVEQYRTEVRNFDSRITANSTAIAAEETARQNADSDLSDDISAETTARVNAIQNLSDAISAETIARENADTTLANRLITVESVLGAPFLYSYFKNFNAVIIGDSYAYGTGASDHLSGDTKRWSSLLCTWLGANEFNFAVGSTGFCDPGSSGQNAPFKTQVNTAAADMTETQIENTHLVVIAGGINDFREGATYGFSMMEQGAYDAAKNAANNFQNALILVVPMLFNGHGLDARALNFEDAIISGVGSSWNRNRTVYIQGAWTWNFGENNFANDELHPNDTGHRVIAANIYSHIFGGEAYKNKLLSLSFEDGYSGSVAQGTYFNLVNGVVQSTGMYISGSIAAGATTKIGTVPNAAYPLVNVCVPIMNSNAQAGIAIITSSGNLYIHNDRDSSISDPYIAPFSYIPTGKIN